MIKRLYIKNSYLRNNFYTNYNGKVYKGSKVVLVFEQKSVFVVDRPFSGDQYISPSDSKIISILISDVYKYFHLENNRNGSRIKLEDVD